MTGKSVSDHVLSVLLQAMESDGVRFVSTGEVARRAGVPLHSMLHVLPVLMERGHLDIRTRAGTLKLSERGIAAARALG